MNRNSNSTDIIIKKLPVLSILENGEKWSIFILSPIFGSVGLVGNLVLLIFHIKTNIHNIRFSIKLLILYSFIQIIMSLTLISSVPIMYNTYFEIVFIPNENKFIQKFSLAFLFFLSFTLFCVIFLAVLLALIAFDRFISVYLVLKEVKSHFKILIWIILLISLIISVVTSYYGNRFCESYCPSTIVTVIIYIKSVFLQIVFYCLISVILIKKNRKFQNLKIIPVISITSEVSNREENFNRLPKTGKKILINNISKYSFSSHLHLSIIIPSFLTPSYTFLLFIYW